MAADEVNSCVIAPFAGLVICVSGLSQGHYFLLPPFLNCFWNINGCPLLFLKLNVSLYLIYCYSKFLKKLHTLLSRLPDFCFQNQGRKLWKPLRNQGEHIAPIYILSAPTWLSRYPFVLFSNTFHFTFTKEVIFLIVNNSYHLLQHSAEICI